MTNIYKITNLINNKVYIGKTVRKLEVRFKGHLKAAESKINRYLCDAVNHYGKENFKIELIEQCERENENEREKYWIKTLNSNNKKFGYNMTEGGDGGQTRKGVKQSEETKRKISEKNKGKVRTEKEKQNLRDKNLGKKHSIETRKKMSESRKKRPYCAETFKKIWEARRKNGTTSIKMSEETKIKISQATKGKLKGKMSEETKKKLSEINKGKPWSEARRQAQIYKAK
jgi:group I intron endonuclease